MNLGDAFLNTLKKYKIIIEQIFWKIVGVEFRNANIAEIWQGIESGLDVDQMVEKMVETYEVEPDKAREDIQAMVDKMKNAGIIVE